MVAACKDCSLPPRLPEPGKRGFSCPSGQAQKKNWQLQEQSWTDRQTTSWLSALCYSVELRKFLRLNWTFSLKNRNQNKLRFSHWLIEKFGKTAYILHRHRVPWKPLFGVSALDECSSGLFPGPGKHGCCRQPAGRNSDDHESTRETDRQIAEMWQEEHIAYASYTRSAAVSATLPAQYSSVVRRGRGGRRPPLF